MKQLVKIDPKPLALYGGSLVMGEEEVSIMTMDMARVVSAMIKACGGVVRITGYAGVGTGITSVMLGRKTQGGQSIELILPQTYYLFELGGCRI